MIATQEIQENVLSQVTGSEMNEIDEPPSGLSVPFLLPDDRLYPIYFIETKLNLNYSARTFIQTSLSFFLFGKTIDFQWLDYLSISDPYFLSENKHLSINTSLSIIKHYSPTRFGFDSFYGLSDISLSQHAAYANDCQSLGVRNKSNFVNKYCFMPITVMKFDPVFYSLYIQYQVCTPDGNQLIPRQPDY